MSGFKKATKSQSRLRLALVGPSGSGKTYSALRIAKGLGGTIALIDTERGSASKYAGDVCDFDVLELESYAPQTFVDAIKDADRAGYDVLIIDSLSHAWMGKDGALEMVDKAAKRSQSGNSFMAWRDVTPQHNALVDAILQSRCHVIATMRAKTEYVLEEDARGKKQPKKIGLAPVQRDGLEYEFDVVADITQDHEMLVGKTRCAELDRAVMPRPGEDVALILKRWLTDGAPRVDPREEAARIHAQHLTMLLENLERCDDAELLTTHRESASRLKPQMSREEAIAVRDAIQAAIARIERIEADREEAERVEREIEAAEQRKQEQLAQLRRDEQSAAGDA